MNLKYLSLEQRGSIFIITLRNGEDNRLNGLICREIIAALDHIRETLGTGSEGAVIVQGNNAKFFTNGIDLEEAAEDPNVSADAFYPMLHAVLDFPFPTIALITGHTFGGGCPFSLAFDYRIMNSERGFFCMVAVDFGLHFPGIGALPKAKLRPMVAQKVLLEGHKYTGKEALEDGVVHAIAPPDKMLDVALVYANRFKTKAKADVYGLLRGDLVREAIDSLQKVSYVHNPRKTKTQPARSKL